MMENDGPYFKILNNVLKASNKKTNQHMEKKCVEFYINNNNIEERFLQYSR